MYTILAFNNCAALVGDTDGRVRTELRSNDVSSEDWEKRLRDEYLQPDHWYPDEDGAPFSYFTGNYWDENGQMMVEGVEGTKPYETFSNEAFELSVRAAFLPNAYTWVIADRKREPVYNPD